MSTDDLPVALHPRPVFNASELRCERKSVQTSERSRLPTSPIEGSPLRRGILSLVIREANKTAKNGDVATELMRQVEAFDPISLQELDAHAGLQMRVNREVHRWLRDAGAAALAAR